jgi:hypothetical protein
MSNEEIYRADSPEHDQPGSSGASGEIPRKPAESGSAGEAATPAGSSRQGIGLPETTAVPAMADDGPPVSRARARTVAATGSVYESGDATTGSAVANASGEAGRSTIGADRVEILRGDGIDVEAGTVRVERGGIAAARADTVDVVQGGIGRLVATNVQISQGGIGAARAERITIDMGGVGAAMAGRLELSRGAARSVLAREAHLEQAFAQTVVANHVTMARGSGALVVIGRRIEGEVRTLLDWRGALALGAALGLVLGLVRTGSRARQRR